MIVFSVLNRLVSDDEDEASPPPRGAAASRSPGANWDENKSYRPAVRRNLEWLLNTRKIADAVPEDLKDVERSVYCYGLPDLASLNLNLESRQADQDRLASIIARAIEIFEPRILNVRVSVSPRSQGLHAVRFQVSGRLQMTPKPEPVAYDADLDVTRGEYKLAVTGQGRA